MCSLFILLNNQLLISLELNDTLYIANRNIHFAKEGAAAQVAATRKIPRRTYTAQATALPGAENTSHGWTITCASITVQADNKQSTAGEVLLELTDTLVGNLYGSDALGELTLATTAADTVTGDTICRR